MSGTFTESDSFDATVAMLATTDLVQGGPTGAANATGKNLTNRSRYLFNRYTSLLAQITAAQSAINALQNSPKGFSHITVIAASTPWVVPDGTNLLKVRLCGGGGGGGGSFGANSAGVGGAGGGYAEGIFAVTGGSTIAVTIGAGGSAGAASPTPGGTGGTTSFGALISATGGEGGAAGNMAIAITPNGGGIGTGGDLQMPGLGGGFGYLVGGVNQMAAGTGGAVYSIGSNVTSVAQNAALDGTAPIWPGIGGKGGVLGGAGAEGASGFVVLEY